MDSIAFVYIYEEQISCIRNLFKQPIQRWVVKVNLLCEQGFLASCLFGSLFDPDNGGITFLRNVAKRLTDYTMAHHRRK
jgi:hypothetical protein